MPVLRSLVLSLCMTAFAAAGVSDWESAIAPLSPGFVATDVSSPTEFEVGTYDASTGGGVTYELIYNADVGIGFQSSALFGSRDAPVGDSAGFKLDQFPNMGRYGVTFFGVEDIASAVPSIFNEDTHLALVVDGVNAELYLNGAFVRGISRGSFVLSGLTGVGHAYVHSADVGVDTLNGEIFGIAFYDYSLSEEQIAANHAAFFVPEPFSMTMIASAFLAVAPRRLRARGQRSVGPRSDSRRHS